MDENEREDRENGEGIKWESLLKALFLAALFLAEAASPAALRCAFFFEMHFAISNYEIGDLKKQRVNRGPLVERQTCAHFSGTSRNWS